METFGDTQRAAAAFGLTILSTSDRPLSSEHTKKKSTSGLAIFREYRSSDVLTEYLETAAYIFYV